MEPAVPGLGGSGSSDTAPDLWQDQPWTPVGVGVCSQGQGTLSKGRWDTDNGLGETQSRLCMGWPRPPAPIPGRSSPGCPSTRRCRALRPPHAAFYGPAAAKAQTWAAGTRGWSLPGAGPDAGKVPQTPPARAAVPRELGLGSQEPRVRSTPIAGVPRNSTAHPTAPAPAAPSLPLAAPIPAPHSPHPASNSPAAPMDGSCPGVTPVSPNRGVPAEPRAAEHSSHPAGHTQLWFCSQR